MNENNEKKQSNKQKDKTQKQSNSEVELSKVPKFDLLYEEYTPLRSKNKKQ